MDFIVSARLLRLFMMDSTYVYVPPSGAESVVSFASGFVLSTPASWRCVLDLL